MLKKHLFQCWSLTAILLSIHPHGLAQQSTAPGVQNRLAGFFSNTKEEALLEPEQAFKLKIAATGPATLRAELIPANGYYLYKDRIRFEVKNTAGVSIKTVKLPPGKIKIDRTFGRLETYEKPIQAEIILERAATAKAVTVVAAYQGCNERTGVCYPPFNKELSLSLP